MKFKVKLFATLRNGRGKEIEYDLEESVDVRQIIKKLEISEEDVAILLVNGRDAALDRVISDGDTISIFPPVGGG